MEEENITIDGLARIVKKEFDKMDKRFDNFGRELRKKPTKKEIFNWADEKILNLELDIDKVKYIHRDKWNKLPNQGEISRKSVAEGLK